MHVDHGKMQLICFAFSAPLKKTNLDVVCDLQTADCRLLAVSFHCRLLAVSLHCSLLAVSCSLAHTYIILVLAQKKIKIQNNADLTRNSAPMLASFLVKSALFCIFIFFSAKTSIIYVCGGI